MNSIEDLSNKIFDALVAKSKGSSLSRIANYLGAGNDETYTNQVFRITAAIKSFVKTDEYSAHVANSPLADTLTDKPITVFDATSPLNNATIESFTRVILSGVGHIKDIARDAIDEPLNNTTLSLAIKNLKDRHRILQMGKGGGWGYVMIGPYIKYTVDVNATQSEDGEPDTDSIQVDNLQELFDWVQEMVSPERNSEANNIVGSLVGILEDLKGVQEDIKVLSEAVKEKDEKIDELQERVAMTSWH